ncbi:hypothetical protein HZS_6129 [Henneguya salminicola]|nr:hypothetical protein HZS_6129 [Henneguya salminicola]
MPLFRAKRNVPFHLYFEANNRQKNVNKVKELHSIIGVKGFFLGYPSRFIGNILYEILEPFFVRVNIGVFIQLLENISFFKCKNPENSVFDDGSFHENESPSFVYFIPAVLKRCLAKILAMLPCYPFFLISTRMTASSVLAPDLYRSFLESFKDIVLNEGFSGLFQGLTLSLTHSSACLVVTFISYFMIISLPQVKSFLLYIV